MSTSSIKRQIRRFHVVVVQWTSKKCTKTRDAHAGLLFWSAVLVFCCVFDILLSFNPTLIQTTSSGKIIAKPSSILREMEELHEESGLVCCICREGYKYHPQKVRLLLRFWRNVLSLVVKSFTRHSSVFLYLLKYPRKKDNWRFSLLPNKSLLFRLHRCCIELFVTSMVFHCISFYLNEWLL